MEKIKLFLLDDHQIMLDGMRSLLHDDDSFVIAGEATRGDQALKEIALCHPDIVITDISMPCLNGIELTRSLRCKAETAALPILAITAFGQTTMRAALAAGASACVRKPVVMAEFLPMIKDLMA